MNKTLKRSIVSSIICHFLLILLLGVFLIGGGYGNGGGKDDRKKIVEKHNEELTEVELPNEQGEIEDNKPKNVPTHLEDDCTDFYGGIGITHILPGYTVSGVYAGYPAFNAGIKVGDRIVSNINAIRGEINTSFTLEYENETGYHKIVLIRDKICTNKVN